MKCLQAAEGLGWVCSLWKQSLFLSADLVSPSCFPANNYVESKCEAVLQEMRKCCARYTKGRSVCCSGFEREEREREKVRLASEGISPPPQ